MQYYVNTVFFWLIYVKVVNWSWYDFTDLIFNGCFVSANSQTVLFSCKFKRYSNLHLSQLVTSQNNVHPWYVDNRSMFYCILKRWFICIVQTLGDPERRSQYDKFGYTSAKDHRQQSRGSPFGDPFHGDPFEGFFHNFHNFKFNFGGSGFTDSFIEKNEINMRYTLYL